MIVDQLKNIVGPSGWTSNASDLEPHLTEWRDIWHGKTLLMVSPESTEMVAEVVRACAKSGTAIVPQGGNTGLCGGAIPDESGQQVLLSLSRMNRIRAISAQDYSLSAEAGCTLASIQTAAEDVDRFFPLSLAAEGSCQIGGNLSTNAGGINVLRYGTARAQALGLAGCTLEDMGTVEINEAFAAQVLACARAFESDAFAREHSDQLAGRSKAIGELDLERTNPNGGAIALGHPVGATGARLLLTTALEMARGDQAVGLSLFLYQGGTMHRQHSLGR